MRVPPQAATSIAGMMLAAVAALGGGQDTPQEDSSRWVFVLLAAIVTATVAIVGTLLWQSEEDSGATAQEAERVADQALTTLRNGDGGAAYSLACEAVRDEHSLDEYTELWLRQPRPESWEWRTTDLSQSRSGVSQAEVIGTAVVEGEETPWSVYLVHEGGAWRTCAFPED